jgi:hypothetical protein
MRATAHEVSTDLSPGEVPGFLLSLSGADYCEIMCLSPSSSHFMGAAWCLVLITLCSALRDRQTAETLSRVHHIYAPRRNVRSTPDGGSAVQPPGLSDTAHWEALGCALCLLATPEISSTGPVRGRGFCPGSHRPRARVPLVVWSWDFFLLCGFLAAVSRPLLSHCFSLCDLRLFVNKRMLLSSKEEHA